MTGTVRKKLNYAAAVAGPFVGRHLFRDVIWNVDCARDRIAYLTFDDGPTPHLTPRLLEILDAHGATATFFLLGKHIEKDPGAVERIERGGHRLALHGFNHLDAWKTEPAAELEDLDRGYELLSSMTSTPIRYFRPPFGRFRRSTRSWAKARGLSIVMWDVMPGDFIPGATSERIVSRVRRRLRSGSVVVLHDSWNQTVVDQTATAVNMLLSRLRDEGWRFEAL